MPAGLTVRFLLLVEPFSWIGLAVSQEVQGVAKK